MASDIDVVHKMSLNEEAEDNADDDAADQPDSTVNITFERPEGSERDEKKESISINISKDMMVVPSTLLANGILSIVGPPIGNARNMLKELIAKQNRIYVDTSQQKHDLDNADTAKLNEFMNEVQKYKSKLRSIKKEMRDIYDRTATLKKRANNIQAAKQKQLNRVLQKQQLEESLIANPEASPQSPLID